MNFSSASMTIRWLIRDTFRQSLASGIFWLQLAISGVAVMLCLSAGIQGDALPAVPGEPVEILDELEWQKQMARPPEFRDKFNRRQGELTLLFGTVRVPLGRDRTDMVRRIEVFLAGGVADTAGILLALIWTAGFLPSFLEASSASVLLAKPPPRWTLLAGKYLGVLAFVLVQATIFVLGTWLALGIKTAVWDPLYLVCIPMLMLHFAIFFSFSVFLAVWTRSTVACVFWSIVFWLMCWGMNYGHHAFLAMSLQGQPIRPAGLAIIQAPPANGLPAAVPWVGLAANGPLWPGYTEPTIASHPSLLSDVAYWVLPKPADLADILFGAMQADNYVSELGEYKTLRKHGAFHPGLSVLSSLLFIVVILGIAGYEFVTTDY